VEPLPRHLLSTLLLLLLALLQAGPVLADNPPNEPSSLTSARERGLEWLLHRQAEDGGWHSETYGAFSPGWGTTGLILETLAISPNKHAATARQRGLQFLASQVDPQGFLPAEKGDSSVYAMASLLIALAHEEQTSQLPDSQQVVAKRLRTALLQLQRTEAGGWTRNDRNYGGWGGELPPYHVPGTVSPANLSLTRYVLKAITSSGKIPDSSRAAAGIFLQRCQDREARSATLHGFVFSPFAEDPLNKAGYRLTSAGHSQGIPYFSATCDGLLAQQLCQSAISGEERAQTWRSLQSLPKPRLIKLAKDREQADVAFDGLWFYATAAFAELGEQQPATEWQPHMAPLIDELIAAQQPDGHWQNLIGSMKEDDPLIATALALKTLTHWQHHLSAP